MEASLNMKQFKYEQKLLKGKYNLFHFAVTDVKNILKKKYINSNIRRNLSSNISIKNHSNKNVIEYWDFH